MLMVAFLRPAMLMVSFLHPPHLGVCTCVRANVKVDCSVDMTLSMVQPFMHTQCKSFRAYVRASIHKRRDNLHMLMW
jgi:hypothetical protein